MRKLLALLLLAILPLTPSWAGVAVECPGEAVAAALAQPPGADVDAADPDCCAEGEARDVQCGSDCTACHGPQGRASPEGYVPRIAGKPAAYLHHQLLNFRDGRRAHAGMGYLLETLSDAALRVAA